MLTMRALIVGLGSIGRRYLVNLKQIEPETFVTVWHQYSGSSDGSSTSVQPDRTVFQLADALETRPEFALITGPASVHVQTALELAEHDVHLLIEKPLSNRREGVDQLLARCRDRELALLVGEMIQLRKCAVDAVVSDADHGRAYFTGTRQVFGGDDRAK